MGIVEEVGPEVTEVKKGDRVIIPFVIACGHCFFCEHELMAACENTNTGRGAILNKKRSHQGPLYLALAICMVVYRVVRLNMYGSPKAMSDHLRCRVPCLMKKYYS